MKGLKQQRETRITRMRNPREGSNRWRMKITVDKRATTVATTIRKHRLKFSTPQSAIGSPPLSPFLPFPMIMLTSTTVSRHTFPPPSSPPVSINVSITNVAHTCFCTLPFPRLSTYLFVSSSFFLSPLFSLRPSNDRFSIKPVIDKPPLGHGRESCNGEIDFGGFVVYFFLFYFLFSYSTMNFKRYKFTREGARTRNVDL